MSEVRKLAAIMAVDVVGYSRLMGADEAGTARAVRENRDAASPIVESLGGRIVKTMGDGVLLEFPSVVAAVECAVAIQKLMIARHADAPQDKRIVYRIGVSLGDVLIDGEDILGDGVNIAARLESICDPGGVMISGSAFDHVRDKVDAEFIDLGEKTLKNIARPVRAFQLQMTDANPADAAALSGRRRRIFAFSAPKRWNAFLIGLALLLVIAGSATWLRPWPRIDAPTAVEPAPAPKRSIAVLPFTNMSAEQNQNYFADGLSDDLTTKLSQIPDLFVIARSSMYAYKGKSVSTQEVAQKLGVRYVLEGSVRRSENRLRINANLIEANSARQLWAEEYDVESSGLFAVQDKVIQEIISALAVRLTDNQEKHLARIPTSNLEAYDYYVRAENEDYYKDREDTLQRALQYYDRAIQLDPDFSNAQAGYARAAVEIWRLSYAYPLSSAVVRKRAYDAAGRAIQLDGGNGRAFTALAMLQLTDGRHDEAVSSARRAVALNPSDAEAFLNLAVILAYSGELTEAVSVAEQALRLSPLAPPGLRVLAGIAFYNAHQYHRAIEEFKLVTAAWPATHGAHEYLATSYAHLGDLVRAREEAAEIPRFSLQAPSLAMARIYLGPYYRHAEDLDSHLDALKAAGIPEWPLGFEGRAEDRVIGTELRALTSGRTWSGYVPAGPNENTPFIQQFDLDNHVVYKGARSLLTGTVALSNDQVCISFDGYLWGRPLCGSVYRTASTRTSDPGYIHVMPDSLRYFSLIDD